jgi:6-phosphogluconate dehydrogenase
MEIGMIGLGRMGANMTERLQTGGHRVVVFDLDRAAVERAASAGAVAADALPALVKALPKPRVIWVMVPAGEAVEKNLASLLNTAEKGDVVIDGGNSNYKDTIRRSGVFAERGIHLVDVGTSGGIWGLKEGYCLMIGGEKEAVNRLRPILETLAPSGNRGWAHVGGPGAGHFVKMVHNGIEYGLMQAYAEGFSLLERAKQYPFDLPQIAETWRHGSVVRSWLLDLTTEALRENPKLSGVEPYVEDSGEGRWMVAEAVEQDVPAPIITHSLIERLRSRDRESFSNRLLAVMRKKFGGHSIIIKA